MEVVVAVHEIKGMRMLLMMFIAAAAVVLALTALGAQPADAAQVRTIELMGFSDTTRLSGATPTGNNTCVNNASGNVICTVLYNITDTPVSNVSAWLDLSFVAKGDSTTFNIDVQTCSGVDQNDPVTAGGCAAVGAGTNYTIALDPASPKLFGIRHDVTSFITFGANTMRAVYMKFTGGTTVDASAFSAKLVITYEHASPTYETKEFYIVQDTTSLACNPGNDGTTLQLNPIFQVTLKNTPTIQSAFAEIDGISRTTLSNGKLYARLTQEDNPVNPPVHADFTAANVRNRFDVELSNGSVVRPTAWHILKDGLTDPATVSGTHFTTASSAIKNYRLSVKLDNDGGGSCATALDSYIVSAKLVVTYGGGGGNFQANGNIVSSTLDTQISTPSGGPNYHEIIVAGPSGAMLGASPLGKVNVWLATAPCSNGARNPTACNDGVAWGSGASNYFASDPGNTVCNVTGAIAAGSPFTVTAEPANGVAVIKIPPICSAVFDNNRYFRYKIELCASDCTGTDATTPQVNDVSVVWGP